MKTFGKKYTHEHLKVAAYQQVPNQSSSQYYWYSRKAGIYLFILVSIWSWITYTLDKTKSSLSKNIMQNMCN